MNASLVLGECKELEYFCWKRIEDNLSYKAIDANGNCVGVFLSELGVNSSAHYNSESNKEDDLIYRQHEKFYRIIQLTDALDAKVNLPEMCPEVQEFVHGKVISVDSKYRGRGIAGQLLLRTLEEMKKRSLPLMYIQCSGLFSSKIVQKIGFELVGSIPYKEFLIDGKQVIAPKEPHTAMNGFIKWVGGDQGGEEVMKSAVEA